MNVGGLYLPWTVSCKVCSHIHGWSRLNGQHGHKAVLLCKKTKRCVTCSKRGHGFWEEETIGWTHVTVVAIQHLSALSSSALLFTATRKQSSTKLGGGRPEKFKTKTTQSGLRTPAPAESLDARGLFRPLWGVFAVLLSTLDLESKTR